jgi:methanogenic corrinoid protein MtbC1
MPYVLLREGVMAEKTIEDVIEETAKGPASVSVDGTTVTAQKIADQIEADRYLTNKAARAGRTAAILITTVTPPGMAD